jgi:hypothetical protein
MKNLRELQSEAVDLELSPREALTHLEQAVSSESLQDFRMNLLLMKASLLESLNGVNVLLHDQTPPFEGKASSYQYPFKGKFVQNG